MLQRRSILKVFLTMVLVAFAANSHGSRIALAQRVSKIAFVSNREGIVCAASPLIVCSQIYVMNPDGTGVTRLTNIPGSSRSPAFSPDGSRIAFVHNTYQQMAPGAVMVTSTDIFLMNADGTGVALLAKDAVAPAFTPDGKKIAYAWVKKPYEIYLINADGSNPKLITGRGAGGDRQALSFSPDGGTMAFVCTPPWWDICTVDLKSMEVTKLTHNPPNVEPAFSPDGSKIAFVRDFRIYVMNADGKNVTRLTDMSGLQPTFSPDGSKIAFYCPPGQICVMNADGMEVTRLTNPPGDGCCPSWR